MNIVKIIIIKKKYLDKNDFSDNSNTFENSVKGGLKIGISGSTKKSKFIAKTSVDRDRKIKGEELRQNPIYVRSW